MTKSEKAFEYLKERLSAFEDRIDIRLLEDEGKKIYVEIAYPLNLEAIIRGIVGYTVYDALTNYNVLIKPKFRIKR